MRYFLMLLVLCLAVGCGDRHVGDVPLDDVPEPVMKTAKEKLPNVKFDQAWKTANGNYEVRGKEPNGKFVELD
jgi:hypothetical protein